MIKKKRHRKQNRRERRGHRRGERMRNKKEEKKREKKSGAPLKDIKTARGPLCPPNSSPETSHLRGHLAPKDMLITALTHAPYHSSLSPSSLAALCAPLLGPNACIVKNV